MSKLRFLALLASVGFSVGYGVQRVHKATVDGADARARGRHAGSPWSMTWLGWRDVLRRTTTETLDDRLMSVAASVAFFALLAIIPGLSAVISVYGLIANNTFDAAQLNGFAAMLPEAGRQLIAEQAQRLAEQPPDSLSLKLAASLAIATWSANAATKGVFDGLNVIYEESEKRSFLRLNAVSLGFTVGGVLLMALALFVIALLPPMVAQMPISYALEMGLAIARWPLFFLAAALAIAVLYWLGPSRRPPRFVWVVPGALFAAFMWGAASALFSWYVSKLGNYTASYGSLATVIVFMTWLWLSATVVLIGAELNAELEHQTALDTTIGRPKPLGLRGATVADNIGPAVVK